MDLAHRPASLAKGEWGRLLIVAGSSQLAGAAVLNTLGAARTGLDTIVVAAPERAANAVLYRLPDAVTLSFPGRSFEPKFSSFLDQFANYPVVMGSGLTNKSGVGKFVRDLVGNFKGPFVLDADAIRAVADSRHPAKLWKGKKVLLTPNRSEYASLVGDSKQHPLTNIAKLAQKLGVTILCKGATDVLSDGTQTIEISGGSEFLAKAGTGDLLTGVIGALVAREVELYEAARLGCELVNAASLAAAKERGPGVLTTDIAEYLDVRKLPKK